MLGCIRAAGRSVRLASAQRPAAQLKMTVPEATKCQLPLEILKFRFFATFLKNSRFSKSRGQRPKFGAQNDRPGGDQMPATAADFEILFFCNFFEKFWIFKIHKVTAEIWRPK